MRKIIIFVGMILFSGTILCFAQEETLTITTYYPSPYGSYKQLSIYNLDESTTQTDFTQDLNRAGINITTDYTANAFTPGLFWSTRNNNPSKPKAGIYLRETGSGTYMYFGTSNWYSQGITNDALVIDYIGNVGIGTASGYGDSRVSIYGTNGNNDATLTMAKQDGTTNPVFSILPWDTQVYISSGIYYSNGAWRHYSDNGYNQLFTLDPGGGVIWYASSTSSGSWNLASNVQLWNDQGVWVGPSSCNLKENFTPLDPNDILQRIRQLEITRWNFKAEDDSITHIGPVAEDFHQIFGTGDSNKTLATIDTAGVALAGVKSLLEKAIIQQQQIEELQQEIKELKLKLNLG